MWVLVFTPFIFYILTIKVNEMAQAIIEKIYNVLDKLRKQSLEGIPSYDYIPGSVKTLTYYSGATPNNPSGNANIQYIEYARDGKSFYQELSYNNDDCIIKQEIFKGTPTS